MLQSGEEIAARAVAANVPPKLLFRDLVPQSAVEPELRDRFVATEVGLRHVPHERGARRAARFPLPARQGPQDHHGSGIVIGPSLDYLERAYLDARLHGWSAEPVVEMLIPSTLDDTLAPAGQHVASLFVQHVAPHLPDGAQLGGRAREGGLRRPRHRHGGAARAELQGERCSPGRCSPRSIWSGASAWSTATFSMAQLSLDQLFSARPQLGHADYRMPLPGLYLCGSGAHPGGGVTGRRGATPTLEIIRDFKRGAMVGAA